jgi:hypothetical protein
MACFKEPVASSDIPGATVLLCEWRLATRVVSSVLLWFGLGAQVC